MDKLEHPQPKKLKYNQFGQEDSLTLLEASESDLAKIKIIEKALGIRLRTRQDVRRLLTQYEGSDVSGTMRRK